MNFTSIDNLSVSNTDHNNRMRINILIIEDSPSDYKLILYLLRKAGYTIARSECIDDADQLREALDQRIWNVIISDYSLPHFNAPAALKILQEKELDIPFIVVSGQIGEDTAVEMMRSGAHDYLMKDNLSRLAPVVERELREAQVRAERRKTQKQNLIQYQQLTALYTIESAIISNLDLDKVLNILLEQVIKYFEVDAADVLIWDKNRECLVYRTGLGFHSTLLQYTHLKIGEGYAGKAAVDKKIIYIPDILNDNTLLLDSMKAKNDPFTSYYGVPLVVKDNLTGVLEIFHHKKFELSQESLAFLISISNQAAIAIDNLQLLEQLSIKNKELTNAYDATLEGWAHALDIRHKESVDHSRRVTDLSIKLAIAAGFSGESLEHIRRGALLHDIGKLAIPDHILLKPGKLTPEERMIIQQHPVYAFDWLSPIEYLKPALDIPYCHHEKWDGSGYPRALSRNEIPLAARIFAIVDVWDALRSERPYRAAWQVEKVMEYILSENGKHFDPSVVDLFMDTVEL
ncbi:MAG TPA: HD domain-containing phosphohydrolase [Anaerolineaceae bacterium]